MPDMFHVESSAVQSAGYDDVRGELHIRYTNDRLYVYEGVPESVYLEFLAADSKGEFVNTRIKPNYPFREGA